MNVLVEKPVCLTEEDCQMLLEAEKKIREEGYGRTGSTFL